MASPIDTAPLDSSEAATTRDFHCFPNLPPELRTRIWRMAYDALPDTLVYRFRLKFSYSQSTHRPRVPQAFLVPLKEVAYLTSELRSLQRVNTEARYEGNRSFNSCLRLNQTEKGETTDICPPINLPWKGSQNFFCFVDLKKFDVTRLLVADTTLIDQVFNTVELLGLGLDWELEEFDIEYFLNFAAFTLLFPKIRHESLVSDRLMPEADLENIGEDIRSNFMISSWYDWAGRVPDDVITCHCEHPKAVTTSQHLDAVSDFADAMIYFGMVNIESSRALLSVTYGMIFRTNENLDFLRGPLTYWNN